MLLDTCFLIDLQRELGGGRARGAQRFLRDHAGETPWISLITWTEFAEGYGEEREDPCCLFLSRFPLIVPDQSIAWKASRISRSLRASGRPHRRPRRLGRGDGDDQRDAAGDPQ